MEDTGRPGLAGRTLPNGRKQYYAGRAPQPAGEVGEGPGDVARGRASSSSTPAGRPDARVPAGAAGRGRAKVVGRRCGSPGIGRPLPASATMKEERGAAERLCRRRNRVRVGIGEGWRRGAQHGTGISEGVFPLGFFGCTIGEQN
jgi:hypothetical protein